VWIAASVDDGSQRMAPADHQPELPTSPTGGDRGVAHGAFGGCQRLSSDDGLKPVLDVLDQIGNNMGDDSDPIADKALSR